MHTLSQELKKKTLSACFIDIFQTNYCISLRFFLYQNKITSHIFNSFFFDEKCNKNISAGKVKWGFTKIVPISLKIWKQNYFLFSHKNRPMEKFGQFLQISFVKIFCFVENKKNFLLIDWCSGTSLL